MSDMYTYRLKRKLRRFSMACLTRAHFHVRRAVSYTHLTLPTILLV